MDFKSRELAYLTCFTTGFAILVLELISFRLLAPYFGTSIYVSGIIINTVLLALAAGYFAGGYVVDRLKSEKLPYLVILGSCIYLIVIFSVYPLLLNMISFRSVIIGSSIAIVAMFFVPTALLAFIPPYLIKLLLIKRMVGKASGEIFSLSTLGSIAGGIMTTFIFIPYLGSRTSFLIAIGLLLVISTIGLIKFNKGSLFLILAFLILLLPPEKTTGYVYKTESEYNIIKVVEEGGRLQLRLNHDYSYHSITLDPETHLSNAYYDYYLFPQMLINAEETLILGNGAGTSMMETDYFFDTNIDGVEIDPMVTEVGNAYFGLRLNEGLSIFHQDARVFLNQNKKKYDIVYIDVYSGEPHVPFHIATVEFFELVNRSLNDDGIVAINVPYYSPNTELSEYYTNTITTVFPNSYVFEKKHMLYSFKADIDKEAMSKIIEGKILHANLEAIAKEVLAEIKEISQESSEKVFSDDHAPVEVMTFKSFGR
ncbi:fused MFS/spermidine synthase [Candidatus Woesearchaeota archaeon]|nr:fused MFS/spermidine synthase [Candidatus Woesearchaeota archaeon]